MATDGGYQQDERGFREGSVGLTIALVNIETSQLLLYYRLPLNVSSTQGEW